MPLRLGTLISTCRIILFGTSIIAIATGALFLFAAPTVDAWFDAIPERIARRLTERMAEAQAGLVPVAGETLDAAAERRAQALRRFTALANDLRDQQKGDRGFPIRRDCLTTLASAAADDGAFALSANYASELLEADERDLIAARLAATARARVPESAAEGLDELRALHRRFPSLLPIASALASELFRRDLVAEAFPVILSAYEEVDPRARIPWRIYFDFGDGFDASKEVTPSFAASGELRIGVELIAGTRRLRIDPPPACSLRLSDPALATLNDVSRRTLPFRALSPRLNQMRQEEDGSLTTTGGEDPFVELTLPAAMVIKSNIPIEVLARASRPRNGFIAEVLETARGLVLERELADASRDPGPLRRLIELRQSAALSDAWTSCDPTGEIRHSARAARVGDPHPTDPAAVPFSLQVSIVGGGTAGGTTGGTAGGTGDDDDATWTLAAPAIFGVGYELAAARWQPGDGGQDRALPLDALRPIQDITRDGAVLRVTGGSPTLSVTAPAGAGTLELVGWLR